MCHILSGQWRHCSEQNTKIPAPREVVFYEGQIETKASNVWHDRWQWTVWGKIKMLYCEVCGRWFWVGCSWDNSLWKQHMSKDLQAGGGWALWSTMQRGSPWWGQTLTKRVGMCSFQIPDPSAVAELTRWGSQNPTTPVFRWDYFFLNVHTRTKTPHSYLCPDRPLGNACWTQPANLYSHDLWHSLGTELCKEVTSSDWTDRLSFLKTMKIDWTRMATQKVSIQSGSYAQKPPFNWSSQGWFISSLPWSSTQT